MNLKYLAEIPPIDRIPGLSLKGLQLLEKVYSRKALESVDKLEGEALDQESVDELEEVGLIIKLKNGIKIFPDLMDDQCFWLVREKITERLEAKVKRGGTAN